MNISIARRVILSQWSIVRLLYSIIVLNQIVLGSKASTQAGGQWAPRVKTKSQLIIYEPMNTSIALKILAPELSLHELIYTELIIQ